MFLNEFKSIFGDSIQPDIKNYEPRDFVFHQDKPVEGIYFVEKGQVNLERYTKNGKAIRIHQANEKECFAESALFSEKYNCYAIASKPTRLALFPKDEVINILNTQTDIAIVYIDFLSKHIKLLRTNLELRTIQSASERILKYLILQADEETLTFNISSTLKDISAQLGLTHETLYRELKKLEQKSLIKRTEDKIKILTSV